MVALSHLPDSRRRFSGVPTDSRELLRQIPKRSHVISAAAVSLAESDYAVFIQRNHRRLAHDFEVGEHGAHWLRCDHVRVSVVSDVAFEPCCALTERDEIEINLFGVFRNDWCKRP